jgi:hypothetical protein
MCMWASYKINYESLKKGSDPELDPDPLVRGTDPDVTDPKHCLKATQDPDS